MPGGGVGVPPREGGGGVGVPSGDGLVELDLGAIVRGYRRATKESQTQDILARELRASGWTVLREVYCRPPSGKTRRADLYCVAPEWFGCQLSSVARGDLSHRAKVRQGFTVAVEVKRESSTNSGTDAYFQAVDYVHASVWADQSGNPLPRPDWCAVALHANLVGEGKGADFEPIRPVRELERIMWRQGLSAIARNYSGNLEAVIRVPVFVQRVGTAVFSTSDLTMPLTKWRTGRGAL